MLRLKFLLVQGATDNDRLILLVHADLLTDVILTYLPLEILCLRQDEGSTKPNENLWIYLVFTGKSLMRFLSRNRNSADGASLFILTPQLWCKLTS